MKLFNLMDTIMSTRNNQRFTGLQHGLTVGTPVRVVGRYQRPLRDYLTVDLVGQNETRH